MWLSKMLKTSGLNKAAEKGSVTLSENGAVEAQGSVSAREISTYAPYGFTSAVPIGEEIILIPSTDGQIAAGTKSDFSSLSSGEVKIFSKGGASILLKNDGSVVINSLIIDRNGVIQNDS